MKLAAVIGAMTLIALPALAGPREEMMTADKAFAALSVAKGQAAAFLAYIDDDGRLFGTGGEPIMGRKAAEVFYASDKYKNRASAKGTLNWSPLEALASKDGSMGWTNGRWTFEGAPDAKGARAHASGRYLTIWRRNAAGAWKVAADMGTTDPESQ